MKRRLEILVCSSALLVSFEFGQTQETASNFEVSSVKPPARLSPGRIGCTGDRFAFGGFPLTRLIQWAYGLPPTRIQGLPVWVTDIVNNNDSAYEIEAKASAAVNEAQCKAMVKSLLADRFKMVASVQEREMRVYALTVAKKGHKMREVGPGSEGAGVYINGVRHRTPGEIPPGISMAQFATRLSAFPVLGIPVIDNTGLTGLYTFNMNFSIREDDGLPTIWTALEEQLGLKLESIKAPIEVLVVDRVERPTSN
jgi:uncharacterized protein (TIGR03435 family)